MLDTIAVAFRTQFTVILIVPQRVFLIVTDVPILTDIAMPVVNAHMLTMWASVFIIYRIVVIHRIISHAR